MENNSFIGIQAYSDGNGDDKSPSLIQHLASEHESRQAQPAITVPQPGRMPALTGIRGIAACWVVGYHISTNLAGPLGNFPGRDTLVLRNGYLAVDLFFMLSGFVLAHSYFPRFGTSRMAAVPDFAIGRLFRILPLNWAMLVALLALSRALPSTAWSNEPMTAASFAASMALVQAWGFSSATSWNFPAWSLSAEWAAYTLFPLLLLVGRQSQNASLALAAGAAALIFLCAMMIGFGNASLDHSWLLGLPRCFLQFVAGACFWRAFDLGRFNDRHADATLVIGLAGLAAVIVFVRAELVAPFAFAAIIIACACRSRAAAKLFGNRPVLFLGEISFSIYLSHGIILSGAVILARSLGLANEPLLPRLFFMGAVVLAILGVSTLSWRYIELPGQRAGRRLQRRLAGKIDRPSERAIARPNPIVQ